MKVMRLGTRGSKLALWQAEYAANQLMQSLPDIKVEIKVIKTKGDKILDVALSKIGDKGLFTKELENELRNHEIDMAVHSMKDLPSFLEDDMMLGAVLKRENPADVLISPEGFSLDQLPLGAVLGTSSLRRLAQLKAFRQDFQMVDMRGNVETRLRKRKEQHLDGIILAYAGVSRLGLAAHISQILPLETLLPAAGQGAIAIEIRQGNEQIAAVLAGINDQETSLATSVERAFLAELEGGCQVPIASLATITGQEIVLQGLVASLDGLTIYKDHAKGKVNEACELGKALAMRLLQRGAGTILEDIKRTGEMR